jgi:hypothetical protein
MLLAIGGLRPGWAVLAGISGGVLFLIVTWDALLGGITQMRFLYVLGSVVVPNASQSRARAVGVGAHLVLSSLFGAGYAVVMTAVDVNSVGGAAALGMLLGIVHGALSIPVIGWGLTKWHPLVRERRVQSPGRALMGFGRMTPVQWVVAHAAFGVMAGAMYASAAG